ncbi:MAG: BolA family protein [Candidatus Puniceispirillaceae bacterium]|jgi:BolA protein
MATADTIAQKLKDALSPQHIEVEDVSHHHAGHAGWRDGGGTHFTVTIKAASFAGKSRVQQHRLVNSILADELAGDIHALELHLSS